MKTDPARYPARHHAETTRQRRRREALSASVRRRHDAGQAPRSPRAHHVVRVTSKGATMPLAVFQAADYGQLCQLLGLRPSRPRATA